MSIQDLLATHPNLERRRPSCRTALSMEARFRGSLGAQPSMGGARARNASGPPRPDPYALAGATLLLRRKRLSGS